jgi:hypothetical protein
MLCPIHFSHVSVFDVIRFKAFTTVKIHIVIFWIVSFNLLGLYKLSGEYATPIAVLL